MAHKDRERQRQWRERNADHCRERSRKYYLEHRKQLLEMAAEYRKTHRIEIINKDRKRYRENKERFNKARRERYRINPEKMRKSGRDYYKKNHETILTHRRAFRDANREQFREFYRSYNLRKKYGLSLQDYNAMLEKQNFACAICKKPYDKFKLRLAIDHDHKTGKIRGLLCGVHNRGLGFFQDSPEMLQAAIEYLQRSSN